MINIELGNEIKTCFSVFHYRHWGPAKHYLLAGGAEESLGRGSHMVLRWNREGSVVAKRVRTTQLYCDTTDIRRPSGG